MTDETPAVRLKKGAVIGPIEVQKLVFGGTGLARLPSGKTVLIPGGAIPKSVVTLRVLRDKSKYVEAQLLDVVKKSPLERELPEGWQVYGGCKWLPIAYADQLAIKEEQVRESLGYLGAAMEGAQFLPITPSPKSEGYRNKLEFTYGKYISDREGVRDEFRFGFHKQGEFDRIVNCDFCILGDEISNKAFRAADLFCRASGLPTYDPKTRQGFWRHLVIRR